MARERCTAESVRTPGEELYTSNAVIVQIVIRWPKVDVIAPVQLTVSVI